MRVSRRAKNETGGEGAGGEGGQVEARRETGAQRMRVDLCEGGRVRFLDDPLGRDALGRVNYSEN